MIEDTRRMGRNGQMGETRMSKDEEHLAYLRCVDAGIGGFPKELRDAVSWVLDERDAAADRNQALESENAALQLAVHDLLAAHNRIMSDPDWRTSDNTLWPDACDAGEKARAALEGKDTTNDQ
jgi:hypothetical protein